MADGLVQDQIEQQNMELISKWNTGFQWIMMEVGLIETANP
jgi:hypothetical protein